MKYDKVRINSKQLLSLTGFTIAEFETFVPTFRHHWAEYYSHFTLKGKPKERISYNRKSSQLPLITDKLLFILSYVKNNPFRFDDLVMLIACGLHNFRISISQIFNHI